MPRSIWWCQLFDGAEQFIEVEIGGRIAKLTAESAVSSEKAYELE